ncbi:hypothetical protein AM588_10011275 [Phytophthora nicotianae]|uniref:lipid-A-disaccharide synthase n=1 Tax=Phytophthora nicotianae TaxID=4792 RepID=A0A0W8DAT6_PHYNI|nr:hypothetical protein AM588_10011275 [Phytophthora nicotianae]
MSKAGAFESLFPMQELSVMGLLEVVPHIWRFQRRIHDTLRDIENYQPELILTIDSKGFTFRVLKALQASEQKSGGKRIKKVHYVAPSVWAYKHRGKRDFTELKQLLDAIRVNEVKKSLQLVLEAIAKFKEAKSQQQQSSDAAVAVSGTIVLETTLANLPTVVIYRANRLTEWIAKRLAAVRFVSIPNILLGRPLIPELLFSDCAAPKIAETLR